MIFVLVFANIFLSCRQKENDDRLIAAVGIAPQKAFLEAVCGERIRVIVMIPPGYNHESYEPTPTEIATFSNAAIYFVAGVAAESNAILPSAPDIPIIDLPAEVAKVYPHLEFETGEADPHIWLSPKRAKIMVRKIAEEMGVLDPENASFYLLNAEEYIKKIDSADKTLKSLFSELQNRKFIVFHPAFGYFADEYDLEMLSIEQEGKDTTPERLKQLIDIAKAEGIKTVFYQAETGDRTPDSFAENIGGQKIMLDPLSADYIDNLVTMGELIAESMQR